MTHGGSARATRALLQRRSFMGARVVWPHASLAGVAVPDLLVQKAGGTTYEWDHGSMGEPMSLVTSGRTYSSVKVLWTEAEARSYASVLRHQAIVGGYMPRVRPAARRASRPRKSGEPMRVLALTNYLGGFSGDPLLMECYQRAFFAALAVAVPSLNKPIHLRWRPHPSDSRPRMQATLATHASLNMGVSLEPYGLPQELSWADVVVTSVSSVIIEALDYAVAILVHEIPFYDSTGVLSYFSPERRFRDAADLSAKLRTCLAAIEAPSARCLGGA